ncbi:MAG TPA: universal stress protein [Rhizobiaceae bacterium]|nr:universal stress protein [Rhizobiaceae bacterium]
MGYRTIAAILQASEDTPRVLACAIDLAKTFGGHIVGVHSEPLPVSYGTGMGYPDTSYIAIASEENKKRAAAILAMFRTRVDAADVSAEWYGSESFAGDSGLAALPTVRSADLIVAQQVNPDAESISIGDIEALLFESGRPVLLVPYAGKSQGSSVKRVLIAWNGSKEAARAAFDALPFIKQAEMAEILVIDGEENGSDAKGIAAALGRHGANTAVTELASGGIAIGDVIANRAAETEADLVVMGAYSASWLKEWFFGGATRTALKSMPALTLMSR